MNKNKSPGITCLTRHHMVPFRLALGNSFAGLLQVYCVQHTISYGGE